MMVLLLISFTFCLVCYILVLKKMRHNGMRVHLELLLYPIILILCEALWLVYLIGKLFNYDFSKTFGSVAIYLLLSRGFWNSLAYGLSRKVRKLFANCCTPKSKSKSKELNQNLITLKNYSEAQEDDLKSFTNSTLTPPKFVLT